MRDGYGEEICELGSYSGHIFSVEAQILMIQMNRFVCKEET